MAARVAESRAGNLERRVQRRSPLFSGAVAAFVVVSLAVAAVVILPRIDTDEGSDRQGGGVPAGAPVGNLDVYDVGGTGRPTLLAVSDDSIWTTGPADVAGQPQPLTRTDLSTGEQVARVLLPDEAVSLAVGPDGDVWVVTLRETGTAPHGAILRVDPQSNDITGSVPLESPGQVAVGPDTVWVTDPRTSVLYRIDPTGPTLTATIEVRDGAAFVASLGDAVWVSGTHSDTVSRVDPVTNSVTNTFMVGDAPGYLAATGNEVWVSNALSQSVSRIKTDEGRVDATVDLPSQPLVIGAIGTDLWAIVRGSGQSTEILKVDGSSGTVGTAPEPQGVGAIDLDVHGDALWVLDASAKTVRRLPA